MTDFILNQSIIDGLNTAPVKVTDFYIIDKYCSNYISILPYASLGVICVLTLISIMLFAREHPNFMGFVKMTAFVIIALSFINVLLLTLAL